MIKRGHVITHLSITGFALFVFFSFVIGSEPGKAIGRNFIYFGWDLLKVLPAVFVLIGLFEVWVNQEVIERHLGKDSGAWGYLWGVLLAGTTIGGAQMSFPLAYALYRKGARLGVVFTYVGASAICRIPMTTFEMSFMGVKFTLIRLLTSLPLLILSSMALERYLAAKNYRIQSPSIRPHVKNLSDFD